MMPQAERSRRFRQMIVAVVAMLIITAFLYFEGWAAWYAWPVLALLVAASAAGYWFRVRPNITVWRIVYIMGFACWVELAWVFGWVVVMAVTPLGRYVLSIPEGPRFVLLLVVGFVIGAFVGDHVGRRRNFMPLNLP